MSDDRSTLSGHIIDWLIRRRVAGLVLCAMLALLAVWPATQLRFDRSLESMFREDNEWLRKYREHKRLFGGLDACVVAYTDPELLSAEGLRRLEKFAAQVGGTKVGEAPGVASVFSLAQARRPAAPLDARPLTEQLEQGDLTPEELRQELLGNKVYSGTLIGHDGQTAVVVASLAPDEAASTPRAEVIAELRRIAAEHDPPAKVTGEPVLVHDVYDSLEQDGRRLGIASSLILTAVIAILFRNLRWVILPLLVVHGALLWTKALLVVSGVRMTMVSSPLVALVTVIGVATVVHIAMRFREERTEHPPVEAMRRTARTVGPAVFWTCLTTAAGFGSLMASQIAPVQNFGVMMAIGSLLVFVAAAGLVPGGALVGRYSTDPKPAPAEGALAAGLVGIVRGVERRPGLLAAGSGLLLATAGLGLFQLEVASDFTDNFRKSHPIVQSYDFVNEHVGSVATFALLLDAPRHVTAEFLEQVRSLQGELEQDPDVIKTISLVDLLEFPTGQPRTEAGLLNQLAGRIVEWVPAAQRLALMNTLVPELVSLFWHQPLDPDGPDVPTGGSRNPGRAQGSLPRVATGDDADGKSESVLQIVVQLGPVPGAARKRQLIEHVEDVAKRHLSSARAAGGYILLTFLVQSLMADQWKTFALAVGGIFIMMTLAFRSWRLGLLALVPNAAPILVVVGSMGWVGLQVNVATAMLASVSMGLAVDFSIHYLYRFQRERGAGMDFYAALRAAHHSVGRAMVLANIALVAGFSVLVVSQFIPTVHFGILVSVAMLGGLAGNLIVLPLLLRWIGA